MHLLLLSLLLLQVTPARPGVLAGRLRTIEGAPATGVRVAAVVVPQNPQVQEPGLVPLQYIPPPAALVSVAVTDSNGRYRLENVPPGRYYVLAGTVDAPSYFPSSKTTAEATVVTVASGSTRNDVNFDLLWPLGIRVRGSATFVGSRPSGPITATLSGSRVDEHLETPLEPNGVFEFVRVPKGSFTVSLFPPPPGMRPVGVTVVDKDVAGIELVAPRTHVVTGRVVSEGDAPVPVGLLTFSTSLNQVSASVGPDGSFKVSLQDGQHRVDVGGLPVGYRLSSVRIGSQDASTGVLVEGRDVSGVVIALATSMPLPRVSGRITGLPNAGSSSMKVELRGRHLFQPLVATIRPDGGFEFPKVLPGLYEALVVGGQARRSTPLVVTNQSVENLQLSIN